MTTPSESVARAMSQRDLRAALARLVAEVETFTLKHGYEGEFEYPSSPLAEARAALAADEHGAAPSREPSAEAADAAWRTYWTGGDCKNLGDSFEHFCAALKEAYAIDGVRAADSVGPERASLHGPQVHGTGEPQRQPGCGEARPTSSTDGADK